MRLLNPHAFKGSIHYGIDTLSEPYTDQTDQTFYIAKTQEQGFYLSSKELPPQGTLLLDSQNNPVIITNVLQETFHNSCNLLRAPLLVAIYRHTPTPRDTFGRSVLQAPDLIEHNHCFLASEENKTQYLPDGSHNTLTITLGFPQSANIKSGDFIYLYDTEYKVLVTQPALTGVLKVTATLTD